MKRNNVYLLLLSYVFFSVFICGCEWGKKNNKNLINVDEISVLTYNQKEEIRRDTDSIVSTMYSSEYDVNDISDISDSIPDGEVKNIITHYSMKSPSPLPSVESVKYFINNFIHSSQKNIPSVKKALMKTISSDPTFKKIKNDLKIFNSNPATVEFRNTIENNMNKISLIKDKKKLQYVINDITKENGLRKKIQDNKHLDMAYNQDIKNFCNDILRCPTIGYMHNVDNNASVNNIDCYVRHVKKNNSNKVNVVDEIYDYKNKYSEENLKNIEDAIYYDYKNKYSEENLKNIDAEIYVVNNNEIKNENNSIIVFVKDNCFEICDDINKPNNSHEDNNSKILKDKVKSIKRVHSMQEKPTILDNGININDDSQVIIERKNSYYLEDRNNKLSLVGEEEEKGRSISLNFVYEEEGEDGEGEEGIKLFPRFSYKFNNEDIYNGILDKLQLSKVKVIDKQDRSNNTHILALVEIDEEDKKEEKKEEGEEENKIESENENEIKTNSKVKNKNIIDGNDNRININNKNNNKKAYYLFYYKNANSKKVGRKVYGLFQNSKATKIVILSCGNNITNMYCMFAGCSSLTKLDLSELKTDKVTDMRNMFVNCSSLKELDLSKFNTKNVNNMNRMFVNCSSLKELDLSSFNTSNVTNMSWMFYNCSGLTKLDLSSFNINNVTDMSYMFSGCSSLTELDLSSFNTKNVTDMRDMFSYCSSLTNLDLSSFNTSNVTNMYEMFQNCFQNKATLICTASTIQKITDKTRNSCLIIEEKEENDEINKINKIIKNKDNQEKVYECNIEIVAESEEEGGKKQEEEEEASEEEEEEEEEESEKEEKKDDEEINTNKKKEEEEEEKKEEIQAEKEGAKRKITGIEKINKEETINITADGKVDDIQIVNEKFANGKDSNVKIYDNSVFGKITDEGLIEYFKINKFKNNDTYILARISVPKSNKQYLICCKNANSKKVGDIFYGLFQNSGFNKIKILSCGTKIRNINSMFKDCGCLKELDLSNLDIENVIDMCNIFSGCMNLNSISFNRGHISPVTCHKYLFLISTVINDLQQNVNIKIPIKIIKQYILLNNPPIDDKLKLVIEKVNNFNNCTLCSVKIGGNRINNNVRTILDIFFTGQEKSFTIKANNNKTLFNIDGNVVINYLDGLINNFAQNFNSLLYNKNPEEEEKKENKEEEKQEEKKENKEEEEVEESKEEEVVEENKEEKKEEKKEGSNMLNNIVNNLRDFNFKNFFGNFFNLKEEEKKIENKEEVEVKEDKKEKKKEEGLDLINNRNNFYGNQSSITINMVAVDNNNSIVNNMHNDDIYMCEYNDKVDYILPICFRNFKNSLKKECKDDTHILALVEIDEEDKKEEVKEDKKEEEEEEEEEEDKKIENENEVNTDSKAKNKNIIGGNRLANILEEINTNKANNDISNNSNNDIINLNLKINHNNDGDNKSPKTIKSYLIYCKNGNSIELNGEIYGLFQKSKVRKIKILSCGYGITNMSNMFKDCGNLRELDLNMLISYNVTDMSHMFSDCSKLTSLDLSNLDTKNVTNIECMFSGCSSLKKLDLSKFNTQNVTNMSSMFAYCGNLTKLDLSKWDTKNVTNMHCMFAYCSSLKKLDLSSFYFYENRNIKDIFYKCFNIRGSIIFCNYTIFAVFKYYLGVNEAFQIFDNITKENLDIISSMKKDYVYEITLVKSNNTKFTIQDISFSREDESKVTLALKEKLIVTLLLYKIFCYSNLEYLYDNNPNNSIYLNLAMQAIQLVDNDNINNYSYDDYIAVLIYLYYKQFSRVLDQDNISMDDIMCSRYNNNAHIYDNIGIASNITNNETIRIYGKIFINTNYSTQYKLVNNKYSKMVYIYAYNQEDEGFIKKIKTIPQTDGKLFAIVTVKNTKCQEIKYIVYCTNANSIHEEISCYGLFQGSEATKIEIISCGSEIKNMSYMFAECKKLEHLDLREMASMVLNVDIKYFNCKNIFYNSFTYINNNVVIQCNARLIKMFLDNKIISFDLEKQPDIQKICDKGSMLKNYKITVNIKKPLYQLMIVDITNMDNNKNGDEEKKEESKEENKEEKKKEAENEKCVKEENKKKNESCNKSEILYLYIQSKDFGNNDVRAKSEKSYDRIYISIPGDERKEYKFDKRTLYGREFKQIATNLYQETEGKVKIVSDKLDYDSRTFFYTGDDIDTLIDAIKDNKDKCKVVQFMHYGVMQKNTIMKDVDNYQHDWLDVEKEGNTGAISQFKRCISDKESAIFKPGFVNNSDVKTFMFAVVTVKIKENKEMRFVIYTHNANSIEVGENVYGLFQGSEATKIEILSCGNGIEEMGCMFYGCGNLTELDLYNFNTNNDTDMYCMFANCSSLTKLDLSNFNTKKVENMSYMFARCSSLTKIIFPDDVKTKNVTNMRYMFYECSSLTILDLSKFNTSAVEDMSYMFANCSSLTNLDLSNFNTDKVENMSYIFAVCSQLKELDLSSFNTDKVENMSSMFFMCLNLTKLNLSNFNTSNVKYMSYMFYNCSSLTNLDLSKLDTTNVTNMSNMFSKCSSLTGLDLSSFNTENVRDMRNMFANCSSLKELDLSSFNTSNVTNMYEMFQNCSKLTHLDLSSFNTSNVKNMSYMFYDCSSLTELDLSSFNTKNVTDMQDMFSYCSSLTNLDLSNFNTSAVEDMSNMFSNCRSLVSLNISNFKIANHMQDIFEQCFKDDCKILIICPMNFISVFFYNSMCSEQKTRFRIEYAPQEDKHSHKLYQHVLRHLTCNDNQNKQVVDNTIYDFTFKKTKSGTGYTLHMQSCKMREKYNNKLQICCINQYKYNININIINNEKTYYSSFRFPFYNFEDKKDSDDIMAIKSCYELIMDNEDDNIYTLLDYIDKGDYFVEKCNDVNGALIALVQVENKYYLIIDNDNKDVFNKLKRNKVKEVIILFCSNSNLTSLHDLFNGYEYLESVKCKNLNFSNITDMSYMFANCKNLKTVEFVNVDTSKVTDMSYMFSNCSSLTNLDLSGLNTQNVTDMGGMFFGCSSLTSLNLDRFNTNKVINMKFMFYGCSNLTSLDLFNFSTYNIIDMSYMFAYCSSLTEITFSAIKFLLGIKHEGMFENTFKQNSDNKIKCSYSLFKELNQLLSIEIKALPNAQTYQDNDYIICTFIKNSDNKYIGTIDVKSMYNNDLYLRHYFSKTFENYNEKFTQKTFTDNLFMSIMFKYIGDYVYDNNRNVNVYNYYYPYMHLLLLFNNYNIFFDHMFSVFYKDKDTTLIGNEEYNNKNILLRKTLINS